MSPTQTSLFGMEINDPVPRQHTRCRVVIHSHITSNDLGGTINCTLDVTSCQTGKTIKGGGGASFTLVPRRNYMNYIFPNDYVNIWIDPGDGRGFIRTFFGYVDRVNRDISVGDEGDSSTTYTVQCSDFTKAFDKTNIYFNPHIAKRDDFLGNFAGTKNLAGAFLRTKGVTVYGTPADLVINFATLLLGFGAQFILPPTYPISGAQLEKSRKLRHEWAKKRLPEIIQAAMNKSSITEWVAHIKEKADELVQKWKEDIAGPIQPSEASKLQAKAEAAVLIEAEVPVNSLNLPDVITGQRVEATADKNAPKHLLDLLDFTFIEWLAIDGSIVSAPIWTQQGSVWSLMNSYSNNMINELFCDLRPLGENYDTEPLEEGGYKREPDEHYPKDTDEEASSLKKYLGKPAVRFVPAIIMREHPFSTIESIDASNAKVLKKSVGVVPIGNIWSAAPPNKPGRAVVKMKPLHDFIAIADQSLSARKHLDVAVISVRDILTESVGRSDNDVVNLMELYSDGPIGKHMKFITQDIQPMFIPISAARHGLRVRSYSTRFARFSKKYLAKPEGIDTYGTRQKLARWILMMDHWYQHNIEYLSGTISTRIMPEVRVGYRLDIYERNESYYVEGVNHNWVYPGVCTTTFTVTRGQRNNNFPVYVKPQLKTFKGNREDESRLAEFFLQEDPSAVLRAVGGTHSVASLKTIEGVNNSLADNPDQWDWGSNTDGYLVANSQSSSTDEDIDKFFGVLTGSKPGEERSLEFLVDSKESGSDLTGKGSSSGGLMKKE